MQLAAPSAQIQAVDISPNEGADEYLPDVIELKTWMAAHTPLERGGFINSLLSDVKARWELAEAAGLVTMLDKVRATEKGMKKSGRQPIPGLDEFKSKPGSFRERLMLDAGSTQADVAPRHRDSLGAATGSWH